MLKLFILGKFIQGPPRVVVLKGPLPYRKVLSGSNVDFTWKFQVFAQNMMKTISWISFSSEDNWNNAIKLVQKIFSANISNGVVVKRRSNRVNCTFDFQNQIWTMSCSLTNAKADDSVHYGLKVEFNRHPSIYAPNTTSLRVNGKL